MSGNHIEEQQKWVDEVLAEAGQLPRSQPSPDLFAAIEERIDTAAVVLPLRRPKWRVAAAAAVLLLAINGFAIRQLSQQAVAEDGVTAVAAPQVNPDEALLSTNYSFYTP